MRCAVIQPSYIPWRGYFDQILRSDVFVFYDDVQYDKHGWRNRNRIKTPQGTRWLTIPVRSKGNTTRGMHINDVEIAAETKWNRKHLASIHQSYSKAPFFDAYIPTLEKHLESPAVRLADLTIPLTIQLARELGASCHFVRSSDLSLSGNRLDHLLLTLESVGATHYLSGPSAAAYVEADAFRKAGITVQYMQFDYPEYPQLHPPFDAHVSIVDLLFMLGPDARDAFVKK